MNHSLIIISNIFHSNLAVKVLTKLCITCITVSVRPILQPSMITCYHFLNSFKLCILAYKIVYGVAPVYLTEMYETYIPTTIIQLRTGRGRDQLMLVPADGFLPSKCVFYVLMGTWNKLPYTLRKVECYAVFKQRLKTFMFNSAFDS